MKLLNIIASPRGEKSRTLQLTKEFLDTLKTKYPNLIIEDLDVFTEDFPKMDSKEVSAKYTKMSDGKLEGEAEKIWDRIAKYSNQFLEADVYLISSPIWNFSLPYRLKQYIDVIIQPGILFKFTENGVEGLVKNKKMFCLTSRGSDYGEASPIHKFDFQEPYIRAIFGFIGITDIFFVHAQPMDIAPEITEAKLAKAKEEARNMALSCTLDMG